MSALIPEEIKRATQLFGFLESFAQQRLPKQRMISQHLWSFALKDLPQSASISLNTVILGNDDGKNVDDETTSHPLLTVKRPKLTSAPKPPDSILPFLKGGWEKADGTITIQPSINHDSPEGTKTELFEDRMERVTALTEWEAQWTAWSAAELPAVAAMEIYSKLYDLHSRMELDGEQVELLVADGLLRWEHPDGRINHPILLQRVDLDFDTAKNEFRVVDADKPTELYSTVLNSEYMTANQHQALRTELDNEGFHPLAGELTSGYLRKVLRCLGPNGKFVETPPFPDFSAIPIIGRDPHIILRTRPLGFAAAFRKILDDLETKKSLPVSLTRMLGVENEKVEEISNDDIPPWGDPEGVLLSKPANTEQIRIARELQQNHAVLVQGPPGTGKSHTIANLIGHLVAQGKRILITSHTNKALRVIRGQVVESLQPLCVSVLDNDAEGRSQLESSVRGILTRITSSSKEDLQKEVGDLAKERTRLNSLIAMIVQDLNTVRQAEYEPIVIGGKSNEPAEAAAWVRNNAEKNNWIPGTVEQGAPLALNHAELNELYGSSSLLRPDEESEIIGGLPATDKLLDPESFHDACQVALFRESAENIALWTQPPNENQVHQLENLNASVSNTVDKLNRMTDWQRAIVAVGHGGGSEPDLWIDLATLIEESLLRWDKSKRLLLDYAVDKVPSGETLQLRKTVEEIRAHLQNGGSLGKISLLFKGDWKAFIANSLVNGKKPTTSAEFNAIATHLNLNESRKRLETRWTRLAVPVGLPTFSEYSNNPEPQLAQHSREFGTWLNWWSKYWPPILDEAKNLGLDWRAFRATAMVSQKPMSPFELDVKLLTDGLRSIIDARTSAVRALIAKKLITETCDYLESSTGNVSRALFAAVSKSDIRTYKELYHSLARLHAKIPMAEKRKELIERLSHSAPGWANAIHRRIAGHGSASIPGDPVTAWRWKQLQQELVRRTELDEAELTERLRQCQSALRDATTNLIDRKAWLALTNRIGLKEQQALIGWTQLQKRIGKGTGKRVPALQAEARKKLVDAQASVPVWIMPLSRVAESIDPVNGRFDVVIIDEASQCDITGFLTWYISDQLIVVGDDMQVSPMAVGQATYDTQTLINQYLHDIPNHQLFDGQASIYDFAKQSFGGTIRLREHFRCMPDIIEFSNGLSYDFEIQPLRNPNSAEAPHVVEHVIVGAQREGKINLLEAQTIAALIGAILERREYAGKSIGSISLLGDEQAHLILTTLTEIAETEELVSRRFLAGNPAQFQGDERDLMFLSLVDTPKEAPLMMRQEAYLKQRFNVAASRARDQMWVVHSLDPNRDLKPGDLRRQLIEYVRAPGHRNAAVVSATKRAESPFEVEVIRRLVARGYTVEPQVRVGSYRIDMVVKGSDAQIAVECDGARFHPPSKIPEDLARQAILERCGWQFIRIRSTAFYADPERTMEKVFEKLTLHGVQPDAFSDHVASTTNDPVVDAVRRRAWEIMRHMGWFAQIPETGLADGSEGTLNLGI